MSCSFAQLRVFGATVIITDWCACECVTVTNYFLSLLPSLPLPLGMYLSFVFSRGFLTQMLKDMKGEEDVLASRHCTYIFLFWLIFVQGLDSMVTQSLLAFGVLTLEARKKH